MDGDDSIAPSRSQTPSGESGANDGEGGAEAAVLQPEPEKDKGEEAGAAAAAADEDPVATGGAADDDASSSSKPRFRVNSPSYQAVQNEFQEFMRVRAEQFPG